MARVKHLFRALQRRLPMQALSEIKVLKDWGLEGCAHARPGGGRQVLLVDFPHLKVLADGQAIYIQSFRRDVLPDDAGLQIHDFQGFISPPRSQRRLYALR
jgi:hypothetical protein